MVRADVVSDRLKTIPPYLFLEIARRKEKAIAEGRDLIDFGIGDPDQPTPQPIIDALCRSVNDPRTHRYDESPAGWPVFLDAAQSWFARRFGVELSVKGDILLLIGSKEGLTHLPFAVVNPGETVLVPDPAYNAYLTASRIAGAQTASFALKPELGWLPDFSEIPVKTANAARLMYLNYPNNPTGGTASVEFYADAVRFAKDFDIILCSDCAYSEVTYDDYSAPSVLQVPGAKDVAVEFHSLSKAFNMTGWRIGFAVGNPEVLAALNKLKSNFDSKQFPAVAEAAAFALEHGDNSSTLQLYRKRRDILVEGLRSLGWTLESPRGTFYVWATCPPGYTSIEFCTELLEKAGVLAIPGIGYGEQGEGYIRMSLTVSGDVNGERIAEGVERIKTHIAPKW